MMGRVFSIVQIIAASAMPIAILFFGPLADVISVETILIVSGVLLALVGVVYARTQRNIHFDSGAEAAAGDCINKEDV